MSGLPVERDTLGSPAAGPPAAAVAPPARWAPWQAAAAVTGAYLLFGGLWILLSDRVLAALVPQGDDAFLTRLQTYKGWLFVAFTGLALFALVDRGVRHLRAGQRAVEQSESLFRGVVESNAVAICVWHGDGRVLRANDAYLDLIGFTRADLRAGLVDWRRLTPAEFADRDDAAFAQAASRGGGSDPYEKVYVRKDGRRVPVLLTIAPLAGDPHVGVAAVLDITERKQAEERRAALTAALESASRLKDQFLAMLSHELRTPITAIRLWSDLLRADGGADRQLFGEALDNIDQGVDAQTQLINDLLDVSRIAAGTLRVERVATDLGRLVRSAADAVRPAAAQNGVNLEAEVPDAIDPPLTVMGDPGRLRQVAWNLLINAIKFTPRDGRVTLELHRGGADAPGGGGGGEAVLSVSDTGEGLKPEFVPHLFEPFRQADSSTTRRHGGLGIGLSITKRLVEMHGGAIEAASPGPGKGSTFTVRLPLLADEPGETPAPAPSQSAGSSAAPPRGVGEVAVTGGNGNGLGNDHGERPPLAGVRVLVVDDHAETRRAVSRLLRSQGAEVAVAAGADAAIEQARAAPPRVVVSDIGMPGMDGHDLIRALRAAEPAAGAALPVFAIALTAYAMPEDREKALAAGYDDYLSKPVDFGELLDKVKRGARGTAATRFASVKT